MIVSGHLLKFCSNFQRNTTTLVFDLIRLLTNQSCDEITQCKWKINFKNSLNKLSFILLIVIWSQSASILTKAFTGLLLNTYFNQKLLPIVETIQDIYLNKEISIAADSKIFIDYSKRIDEWNEFKSDILVRIIEFENKSNYSPADYFKDVFRKLINGKVVILMQSGKVREFEMWWKQEKSYFETSSYKYSPNYSNYFVAKSNPIARLIRSLLVL